MSQHKILSIVDLKPNYHQVRISENDKIYIADGKLYQFCRVPLGVTNGVACFQRIIEKFTADNSFSNTFAYLDNITICGKSQEEHDENLNKFTEETKKFNLQS